MTYWIFLISTIAVVQCRPQVNIQEPAVEYITFLSGSPYWHSPKTSSFSQSAPFILQTPQTNAPSNTGKSNIVSVTPKEDISVGELLKKNQIKANDTLAPFRAHPLFHFLKNKNTINTDKIISFRKDGVGFTDGSKTTTLILKPVAKAVAGIEGQAISNPLSKAVLRQGTNVDILFEPEAVAIVGPGGIAHAQSDLEIIYDDFVEK